MRLFLTYKYLFVLLFSFVFFRLLGFWTFFIENIYIPFYSLYSECLRFVLGYIPFSVGDFLYVIAILIIGTKTYKVFKTKNKPKGYVVNFVAKILCVFYVMFTVLWSLNINRIPLAEKLNLKTDYNTKELIEVTDLLADRLNTLHYKYTKNINKRLEIPLSLHDIFKSAPEGYQVIKDLHEDFSYNNPTVKSSEISTVLTYMGFSGYINPFTNEAHVNALMPENNTLMTASHEIAHQIGIVPENEANFLGYLAAKHNPNLYYDYAATSFALRYCLKRYPFKNEEEYNQYLSKLNPGIIKDWKQTKEFWEKHKTFVDIIFEVMYDTFLKVNQQEFGMEGYSKFIDYLIAYELNKKG